MVVKKTKKTKKNYKKSQKVYRGVGGVVKSEEELAEMRANSRKAFTPKEQELYRLQQIRENINRVPLSPEVKNYIAKVIQERNLDPNKPPPVPEKRKFSNKEESFYYTVNRDSINRMNVSAKNQQRIGYSNPNYVTQVSLNPVSLNPGYMNVSAQHHRKGDLGLYMNVNAVKPSKHTQLYSQPEYMNVSAARHVKVGTELQYMNVSAAKQQQPHVKVATDQPHTERRGSQTKQRGSQTKSKTGRRQSKVQTNIFVKI